MIELPQLSRLVEWPTDHLLGGAACWKTIANTWTEELSSTWQEVMAAEWAGLSAAIMRARVTDDKNRLLDGPVRALRKAEQIARAGASDLASASTMVCYVAEDARAAGFVVGEDLSVTDLFVAAGPTEHLARQNRADAFATDLARHGIRLAEIDRRIAGSLNAALAELNDFGFPHGTDGGGGAFDDGSGAGIGEHPGRQPTDPRRFASWWAALSEDQKEATYSADRAIGNHPGMRFVDKDRYNRRRLPELIAAAQADVDRLQQFHDSMALRGYPNPAGPADTARLGAISSRLAKAKRGLEGYRSVAAALHPDSGGPPRYLGLLDDRGHAAISVGNPDSATRNAVFVPGAGADLTAIGDSTARALSMHRAAWAANPELGAADVAVTAWLGYDRPMSLVSEAPWPGAARAGAPNLEAFTDGMRASHIGVPSIDTVIGHSYGSTVLGAAASGGHRLAVDNLVAVASPGMLVPHARGLSINPGGTVYAMTDPRDLIGPAHAVTDRTLGFDPMSRCFGAERLLAGSSGSGILAPLRAHGSYWTNNTAALANVGAVIAGLPPPHRMRR